MTQSEIETLVGLVNRLNGLVLTVAPGLALSIPEADWLQGVVGREIERAQAEAKTAPAAAAEA